MQETTAREECQ